MALELSPELQKKWLDKLTAEEEKAETDDFGIPLSPKAAFSKYGGGFKGGAMALLSGLNKAGEFVASPAGQNIIAGLVKDPYAKLAFVEGSQRAQGIQAQNAAIKRQSVSDRMRSIGDLIKQQNDFEGQKKLKEMEIGENQRKAQAQADKDKAEAELKKPGGVTEEEYKRGMELYKQFSGVNTAFKETRDSYDRLKSAAKEPSAAGDLAIIFNYMKMLDPGSTVREGEFSNAQNSAGIPERIRAQYNKILNGERLTPETRADFIKQAHGQYSAMHQRYKQQYKEHERIGKNIGLSDPSKFLLNVVESESVDPFGVHQ